MRTLTVYYSLDGNTRMVAEAMAKAAGSELFELKEKNAKKLTGFSKYFIGGMKAVFGVKPELEAMPAGLEGYDLVFLGSPVWASSPAPAVNSFLARAGLRDRKLALFCCHGGGESARYFDKMRQKLQGNTVVDTVSFMQPLSGDQDAAKKQAGDWARKVSGS